MHASLETITKVSIWKFRLCFFFLLHISFFFILIRKWEGNLDRLITTLSPSLLLIEVERMRRKNKAKQQKRKSRNEQSQQLLAEK